MVLVSGMKQCQNTLKIFTKMWIFKRCFVTALLLLAVVSFLRYKYAFIESIDHDSANNLLNFNNFHYLIQNEICSDETFLLILIHSAPNHFHHRNLIRDTWGGVDSKSFSSRVVFLLASSPEFQYDIEKENYQHGDIIQGNFIDSYRNLTYKHVMGLKWATENCPRAKYLMKMDDDIFMDVYQFMDYIKKHFTPLKLKNKIACFLQTAMPVVRDPVSKWYVSKYEYSSDLFENYCSGWAYLTSIDAANLLVKAATKLEYFWVDDVHITGTAAKAANISHIKMNELYDLESDGLVDWSRNSENLNWNKMFAPTWGDLVLSRKAYKKTFKCYVKWCKCCYSRKTTTPPTKPSTTRKGVAQLLSIYR